MKNKTTLALVLCAVPLAAMTLPSMSAPPPMEPSASALATYSVDPTHSSMVFRVKHMDVAYFYGSFRQLGGTVQLDLENLSQSKVEVTIAAASVDTGDSGRDKHLKSVDFFNAEEFPSIEFKSKKIARKDGEVFEVSGDLNMHGVTKAVTCDVELTGQVDTPRGSKAGFETTFTIKRSDFGVDYMVGKGLDDEVRVTLSLECNKE
jgi:polyisoprenoid-binding protein YceI